MNIARNGLPWLLMTALSGCAPPLPRGAESLARMDVPLPATRDNGAIASVTAAQPSAAWWQMFDEPRLSALVERGLRDNPSLAELEARVDIAQAQVALADSHRLPKLDSTARVVHEHLSANGDHGVYNDRTMTVSDVQPLALDYHLDLFGRDAQLVAGAAAQTEMARAQYQRAVLLLEGAVVKTYCALAVTHRQLSNQRQVLKLASAIEEVAGVAERAGIQAVAERLQRRRVLAEQRARLSDLTQAQQVLSFALSALLGAQPQADIDINFDPGAARSRLTVPAVINLEVLARRPDITYARWNIQQADHRRQAARLAYYPNIDLRGLVGLNSIGLADLLKAGSLAFAIGPAIDLPLFDGSARDARFAASNAEYDAAVAAYNNSVVNAAQQVASTLAVLDHSLQSLAERDGAWQQAQGLASAAASAEASGVADRSVSLDSALQARLAYGAYLDQQARWLDAIADTATALGGGWQTAPSDPHAD